MRTESDRFSERLICNKFKISPDRSGTEALGTKSFQVFFDLAGA